MAKIEIVSKPIRTTEFLGEYAPQHLYIIYTKDNKEEMAYRGGPEGGDNFINWIRDDLKITKLPYREGHPDYDKDGTHTRGKPPIISGTDEQINPFVMKIDKAMDAVNKAGFDYKIAGVTLGSWQNSNTIARYLLDSTDLPFELPVYSDGRTVTAPGWDESLGHTAIDILINPSIFRALHSGNYKREISSDYKIISYVDKDTGIKVYVQNTGAIKVGNVYIVKGLSEEQVAATYNISIDNVIENYSNDILGSSGATKTFTISPKENINLTEPSPKDNSTNPQQALPTSMKQAIPINMKLTEESYSKFHFAIQHDDLEAVKVLLEHGADVNKADAYGNAPLHYAIGNPVMLKVLLEHGADVNKADAYGNTPLYSASQDGILEIIKMLLEYGVDVNKANNNNDILPLGYAVWKGNSEMVKMLLEHGADVNKADAYGNTPLHGAAHCYGISEIIKMLLEHGADINKANNVGMTPLDYAVQNGNSEMVKMLEQAQKQPAVGHNVQDTTHTPNPDTSSTQLPLKHNPTNSWHPPYWDELDKFGVTGINKYYYMADMLNAGKNNKVANDEVINSEDIPNIIQQAIYIEKVIGDIQVSAAKDIYDTCAGRMALFQAHSRFPLVEGNELYDFLLGNNPDAAANFERSKDSIMQSMKQLEIIFHNCELNENNNIPIHDEL